MSKLLKRSRDIIMIEGTEGRNPFEVFMLSWCVYVGVVLTLGAPTPGSVESQLPHWMVTTWYTLLCAGGLVGLVGVWMGDVIASLLVERAGMMFIAPAGLLYSIALFSTPGYRGVVVGGLTGYFGTAALVRIIRITYQLHRLRVGGDKT